jgi:hypothetical protein
MEEFLPKMKKIMLLVFACAVVLMVLFRWPTMGNHAADAVAPGAKYDIPKDQLQKVEQSALAGRCEDAKRLREYHASVTLVHSDAVKWARMASRCDMESKIDLVALLRFQKEDPVIRQEIDSLLIDIERTSPAEAAKVRDEILRPKATD